MWIFSIVAVEKSDSLFGHVLFLHPKLNEWGNLLNVHELNIVNVSILLPFNDDTGRNTFVAHGLWIWLVILAILIDFVSDLRRGQTVIALYVAWVNSLAFQFFFFKVPVEWYMRRIWYIFPVQTVDAFSVRAVLTKPLHFGFGVFFWNLSAIQAFASWTVVTFRFISGFFDLFRLFFGTVETI